jgi:P-type E1-E2 ATPase
LVTINSDQLVVGDVYQVQEGMKIPADSILLDGKSIFCDMSELTGETELVEKNTLDGDNDKTGADCILHGRSLVSSGFGRAVVVAVGSNTQSGIIIEKT